MVRAQPALRRNAHRAAPAAAPRYNGLFSTMAEDFDSKSVPGLLQAAFSVSLGAAHRGLEALGNPPAAASKMIGELESLLTVPEGAGPALEDKAKAMAGAWMTRGVMILSDFKSAGEKLGEKK